MSTYQGTITDKDFNFIDLEKKLKKIDDFLKNGHLNSNRFYENESIGFVVYEKN